MAKKLGYMWYPKDWRSSRRVFRLSLAQRGFYRELIDMAMAFDNKTVLEIDIWAREFGCSEQEILDFLEVFKNLIDENGDALVKIKGNILMVPSCENRLNLIRGGRKGGETSKPIVKPNSKPFDMPKPNPDSNQIEIDNINTNKKEIKRDSVFEDSVLNFFDLSVNNNYQQAQALSAFLFVQTINGRLEYFKTQFADYKKLKADKKFVHSFQKFIGDQKEQFSNGIWDSENWGAKLKQSEPVIQFSKRKVIDHSKL